MDKISPQSTYRQITEVKTLLFGFLECIYEEVTSFSCRPLIVKLLYGLLDQTNIIHTFVCTSDFK